MSTTPENQAADKEVQKDYWLENIILFSLKIYLFILIRISVRRMKPWRRHEVTQSPMRGNEEAGHGNRRDKGEYRTHDWMW